ncbi:MAG: hypothetical protein ACYTEL_06740 [Planctomycetota bacterium]|jgi:hypothetical protein
MKTGDGLSFFRLLTVAAILGVVAQVSGSRLAPGGTEEKISELIRALQPMRSALVLYRVQHRGRLPAIDSFELFEMAMTTKVGGCGPYVEEIPTNPFNGLETVRFDGEPAGSNRAGWRFDTKAGVIQADDSAAHAAL